MIDCFNLFILFIRLRYFVDLRQRGKGLTPFRSKKSYFDAQSLLPNSNRLAQILSQVQAKAFCSFVVEVSSSLSANESKPIETCRFRLYSRALRIAMAGQRRPRTTQAPLKKLLLSDP